MEFFHKVTRFPFMNTRKVWYGLSALLIVASLGLVAVRGFAVVLMLGIATSMFTAVMGSRALVQIIYGGKRKVDHLSI